MSSSSLMHAPELLLFLVSAADGMYWYSLIACATAPLCIFPPSHHHRLWEQQLHARLHPHHLCTRRFRPHCLLLRRGRSRCVIRVPICCLLASVSAALAFGWPLSFLARLVSSPVLVSFVTLFAVPPFLTLNLTKNCSPSMNGPTPDSLLHQRFSCEKKRLQKGAIQWD